MANESATFDRSNCGFFLSPWMCKQQRIIGLCEISFHAFSTVFEENQQTHSVQPVSLKFALSYSIL